MPKFKIKFSYTIEGYVDLNATDVEEAKDYIEETLLSAHLGLSPDIEYGTDFHIEVFEPEIEFLEEYEEDL